MGLAGDEVVDVVRDDQIAPLSDAWLVITGADGHKRELAVTLCVDTPIKVDDYHHGGILPYVLRQLLVV